MPTIEYHYGVGFAYLPGQPGQRSLCCPELNSLLAELVRRRVSISDLMPSARLAMQQAYAPVSAETNGQQVDNAAVSAERVK